MRADRIDFISSYCNRWCERCAFTSRCSLYAVTVATSMCDGDLAAALELGVDRPQPVDEPDAPAQPMPEWLAEASSPREVTIQQAERAAEARTDENPLMKLVWSLSALAVGCLRTRGEAVAQNPDLWCARVSRLRRGMRRSLVQS